MKKIRLSLFLFIIVLTQLIFAQEKYAVIINAYAPDTKDTENSWALANPTTDLYFEFWNDVYLMWEMLYQRGNTIEVDISKLKPSICFINSTGNKKTHVFKFIKY